MAVRTKATKVLVKAVVDALRRTDIEMSALGPAVGCSETMLNFIRSGKRTPSAELARRILEVLAAAGSPMGSVPNPAGVSP